MATILVIDDSEMMLEFIKSALEQELHTVLTALSGEEALKIIGERSLDLIITDIYMPAPDGLEIMRIARATRLKVPFIAISGYASPLNMFVPARGLGARTAIKKPFASQQLIEAVNAILNLRHSRPNRFGDAESN